MSKMIVDLRIIADPTWRAQDRVQVFADWGTGTIDTTRPLLAAPMRLFPADPRELVGHETIFDAPMGAMPMSGARAVTIEPTGCLENPFGEAMNTLMRFCIVPVAVDQAYGTWKFAVRVQDGAGNQQGALQEFSMFLSGEDPPPLSAFAFDSYNAGTDKVVFAVAV